MARSPKKQPTKVAIYGARGVAREVHQIIEDLAAAGVAISCIGFLVDQATHETQSPDNLPVLGDAGWLAGAPGVQVTIAIGATAPRRRIAEYIERTCETTFCTLSHPRVWLGARTTMNAGSFANVGAIATTDVRIGRHCQLHAGCTIGHDTVLEDFVTVAPGANVAGRVRIGEGTFVGIGAVIINDIVIGRWSTIGAGAVVVDDVPDNAVVAGNPARLTSQRVKGWHLAPQ